jgi:hypothetical protein
MLINKGLLMKQNLGHLFRRKFLLWQSRSYWRSLKGIHQGRRGFVLGNGPSLKIEDLNRLTGEVSIASNKIYLAFDQTRWRPTYHTITDELVMPKILNELPKNFKATHSEENCMVFPRGMKVRVWKRLKRGVDIEFEGLPFSLDPAQGLYGGGTVTYHNLQLAVYLGLDPIYIIGCDHYYADEEESVVNRPLETKQNNNHFIKGYRKPGEIVNPAPIEVMNDAYETAAEFSRRSGVRIINATRGGYLESFPRVNLDEIL